MCSILKTYICKTYCSISLYPTLELREGRYIFLQLLSSCLMYHHALSLWYSSEIYSITGLLRTWHLQPAELQQTFFLWITAAFSAPHTEITINTTTTESRQTCRYDHGVVLFEFGDVFVSSGDFGLVQGPEAAHHSDPALRCVHHVCCCCRLCSHRPSK